MIIGTDSKSKFLKAQAKKEVLYKDMVPHLVFAWLPLRLADQRYAWLQRVWRFGANYNVLDNRPSYYYCLTESEALNLSKQYNGAHDRLSDIGKAAKEYLGVYR